MTRCFWGGEGRHPARRTAVAQRACASVRAAAAYICWTKEIIHFGFVVCIGLNARVPPGRSVYLSLPLTSMRAAGRANKSRLPGGGEAGRGTRDCIAGKPPLQILAEPARATRHWTSPRARADLLDQLGKALIVGPRRGGRDSSGARDGTVAHCSGCPGGLSYSPVQRKLVFLICFPERK